MNWPSLVIADFFKADDVIENIAKLGTFIVAIWGVWKAVNAFKIYGGKRADAVWNFYAGLDTFLYRLKLTIGEKGSRQKVTKYFYADMPDAQKDIKEIETFQKLAAEFLHFLSTSNGQVPPFDDFDSWQKMRHELVRFLNSAQFLCVRKDITQDELEVKLNEIHDTIDEMQRLIRAAMEDLKKDIMKFKLSDVKEEMP